MKNSNKTGTIGVIITIIVLIVVVVVSQLGIENNSMFGNVVSTLFTPVQNGISQLAYKMSKVTSISDLEALKKENEELKAENEDLKESQRELEVIKSENDTLKEYQNLQEKFSVFTTVPGLVIERSYSNYDKILVINLGASDGIEINMAVVCAEGLVGHVISVTEHTAKVQTLADTASTISANITTSDQSILVKGTIGINQELKATSIPAEATIMQGDRVTTSGLGGIYPKGILLGTISEIINTKNQTDRYAVVVPSVNFNTVDTILVITSASTENS